MKRVALFWLALCGICLAQEVPVEIDLVPPTGVATLTVLTPVKAPEREWSPPARPCRLCGEIKVGGVCSCYDPLTQEMAPNLLSKVKDALSQATGGRMRLTRPVSIRAVSRQKLYQVGGERLLGLYEDGVIWISDDLNRRQATGVIAHEVGHAWFFQNRGDVNTPNELLFEGFAEWVSYLVLKELGDTQGASRIAISDDSVYGRGARRLIARQRSGGLESVISLILTGRVL